MPNQYDKILKENIANLLLPLSDKYFGFKIAQTEDIKDKLQTTIEREPDFLRIIETDLGEKFILQLDFQTKDEPEMLLRMQEYHALLVRKHKLQVRQFVIYFGKKPSTMKTTFSPKEVYTGFQLLPWHGQSYSEILKSEVPEEVILAILADFERDLPARAIENILQRLYAISENENAFTKYVRQLVMLSRMHKISTITLQQIENMYGEISFELDYQTEEEMKTDAWYVKGEAQQQRQDIIKFLKKGKLTPEDIADTLEIPLEKVLKIKQEEGI
jgi:hypothetical protein